MQIVILLFYYRAKQMDDSVTSSPQPSLPDAGFTAPRPKMPAIRAPKRTPALMPSSLHTNKET